MYSFRDLKSLISETDESEPSHTLINYKYEDSDMVESNTETGTGNASFVTKKKLKTPTPFSKKERTFENFSKKSRFISWQIVGSTLPIWTKFSLSSLLYD